MLPIISAEKGSNRHSFYRRGSRRVLRGIKRFLTSYLNPCPFGSEFEPSPPKANYTSQVALMLKDLPGSAGDAV